MHYIPPVFHLDTEGRADPNRINPTAHWVLDGHGTAHRKHEGIAVALRGGAWWIHHRAQLADNGRPPQLPNGYLPDISPPGWTYGWAPLLETNPHTPALTAATAAGGLLPVDTYELVGPGVRGNIEGHPTPKLIRHAEAEELTDPPRTYADMRRRLSSPKFGWAGLIFHHPAAGAWAQITPDMFGRPR